jgi:hypothetical protein
MTKTQRIKLRTLLAVTFSANHGYSASCFEACDIPDREEIEKLEKKIARIFAPRSSYGVTRANVRKPWTPNTNAMVVNHFNSGMAIRAIAEVMERSERSVRTRLKRLGCI